PDWSLELGAALVLVRRRTNSPWRGAWNLVLMIQAGATIAAPIGLVDLAAARIGGVALVANDEFFAEKENLLKPGRGIFIPEKYTDRGKWMDGWETRRRRTPGHDWCVIRLALPGVIKLVDIDTN